jgi:hypothetical protein
MAIKISLDFVIQLRGDGASTTFSFAFGTAPIGLIDANGSINLEFVLAATHPSGVGSFQTSDPDIEVATGVVANGQLALTFSAPIPTGEDLQVYGTFVF